MNYKKYLDISKWQGSINFFDLFDETGAFDGIMIRMGYGEKYDELVPRYVERCQAYNIDYGFYWYFDGKDTNDALIQSNMMLSGAKAFGNKNTLPLAMDYEIDLKSPIPVCKAFLSNIELIDKFAILYTNQYRYDHLLNPIGEKYMLWCARYPFTEEMTLYDDVEWFEKLPKHTQIWQYTSRGKVKGITTNTVDLNLSKVDLKELYWKVKNPISI